MSVGSRLYEVSEGSGWPLLGVVNTYLRMCDEVDKTGLEGRLSHVRALAFRRTELYYRARKNLYGKIPATERTQESQHYKIFR